MNLDQLRAIMKKHGVDPNEYRIDDYRIDKISDGDLPYWENKYPILQLFIMESSTCCGANEIGDIDLSDAWMKFPPEVQRAMISYLIPDSKRFQIVYSLEKSKSWERFNECLFELGWTPLKRWKGNGKNIIQAWCK